MPDKWRIVVGSDDAGLDYKNVLKDDLLRDDRVAEVIDVGVDADEPPPTRTSPWRQPARSRGERRTVPC